MGAEVFVLPQPIGSKQGYQQLDEAYNYITSNGVNVRSIWLQVTSPINWSPTTQNNINFILSFLQRTQGGGALHYTNEQILNRTDQ